MKLVPNLCAVFIALATLVLSPNGLAANNQIDQKHPTHIKKPPVAKGAAGAKKTQGTKKASGTKGARSLGDIGDQQMLQVQNAAAQKNAFEATMSNIAKKDSKTSNSVIQNVKH